MADVIKPKLCFIHVQKCGGESLKESIYNSFLPHNEQNIIAELDAVAATQVSRQLGTKPFEFRDQLLSYHLGSNRTRAVMGHFRFTAELHDIYMDTTNFVTILRAPEDRLLSAFFYDKYKTESYAKINDTLRDFLLDKDGQPTLRSRVHAGRYLEIFRGDGSNDARSGTSADIAAAIENLKRFKLVGFLEHMDPFIQQLSELADVPVELPYRNRNPATLAEREELTDELQEVVTEICRPARIVYEQILDHALG